MVRSLWIVRHARPALRGLLLGGLVLVSALVGCSAKQEPAHGQLMVALSADMSIPKDVTHIRVNIKRDGLLAYQYDFQIAPDGEFHLPGTLAIVAGSTEAPTVSVEVIGIRVSPSGQKEARTFSKVVTTVPKHRMALLRVPVQWLCDQTALTMPDDGYASTCAPVNGQEAACAAGSCAPVALAESALTTYAPQAVFGGAPGPAQGAGQCFDTVACLQPGQDVVPAADCSFPLPDANASANVGIVLAAGGDGICPSNASADCYIPLDQDSALGWHFRDPNATTARVIELPVAVCTMLQMGRAKGVRVSSACPSKTPETPTCGPWSSVVPADGGVTGPDGGMPDASPVDSGGPDASGPDASGPDASGPDASRPDASPVDSGTDSGQPPPKDGGFDAGKPDAGLPPPATCTDPLTLADPALDTAVRGAIGTPSPTPILASDAAKVLSLNLSNRSLTTVSGVECFPNLVSLTLSSNQVTDLGPLSTLTALASLDVSYNPVSELGPLSTLSNLTYLELMGDQVSVVQPLSTLSKLQTLDLSSNLVVDPSALSTLTSLTSLLLDNNRITNPQLLTTLLSMLTSVTDVRISNSALTDADLVQLASNNPNITALVLLGNQLTDLSPIVNLTKLTFLDVNINQITDLSPISSLPITDLSVSENPIADLSPVSALSALRALDASDLQLSNPTATVQLLASKTTLQRLSMNGDGLTDISALSTLTDLNLLFIGGNGISDISVLQGLVNLTNLDISSNQITTLTPLVNNTGIGAGDSVFTTSNLLDCTSEASNVASLRAAGVNLTTDCP